MSKQIISALTRHRFLIYLVNFSACREINAYFESGNIFPPSADNYYNYSSKTDLIDRCYETLDFSSWDDVQRLLKVYELIINDVQDEKQRDALCNCLKTDGFNFKNGRIVPSAKIPAVISLKTNAIEFSLEHLNREIDLIEDYINSDPYLAVKTAKELVESCCNRVMEGMGKTVKKDIKLTQLVKDTFKELNLNSEDTGSESLKKVLKNLTAVVEEMTQLVRQNSNGLKPSYAQLTAGSAILLANFLFEAYKEGDSH